ncbi:MAG: uracil-DNA glycosylase [Xanthobacteraceae bacterium]|nr:uracil-DNA glycosylase [Xanthobacteraceae bacterium]QYK45537.1 MAG: uracil-DNA glycosylase [Xanthobacteraceae bacterium]
MTEPRPHPFEVLRFYAENGVDIALDEIAPHRLAEPFVTVPEKVPVREPLARPFGAPPGASQSRDIAPAVPEVAVRQASELARAANTLDELRLALESFDGCALKTTAMKTVFADGNPQSRVMFVGEGPGAEEDREGLPFVGRSGKLLDLMMKSIGLDRTNSYIANIIPWRPPGNRTPTPQESAICLPFIRRQIELANPDILVCLGGPSASTLLELKEGITRTRGRWFEFDTGTRRIKAIALFHPAYLLRSPAHKKLAWQDLLAIKKALAN